MNAAMNENLTDAWTAICITPAVCAEWSEFNPASGVLGEAAKTAGAVSRKPGEPVEWMHHAPNRWLLPNLQPPLRDLLLTAETRQCGVLTQVSGKWQCIRLLPPKTTHKLRHPLGAGMPVELILEQRQCAAIVLFDCPVIVESDDGLLSVWVESSYLNSFLEMLKTLDVKVIVKAD
jgi:hypothetical protein